MLPFLTYFQVLSNRDYSLGRKKSDGRSREGKCQTALAPHDGSVPQVGFWENLGF